MHGPHDGSIARLGAALEQIKEQLSLVIVGQHDVIEQMLIALFSRGHWHYAHFYYSQVQYREGGDRWETYRNEIAVKLLREAQEVDLGEGTGVQWNQGYIGPVYTTALNLIILQLDKACLPIYQR